MTFAEAEERPFETIISGPVAGAEGAAELARQLELGDVITADVGGTSFDTCLITDGRAQVMYQGEVVGPAGADAVGRRPLDRRRRRLDRVRRRRRPAAGRPASAGAEPGPACYGRGGERADGDRRRGRARDARRGRARGRDRPRRASRPRPRSRLSLSASASTDGGRRARDHDDRRRQHGRRDPRDHDRAGPRPARRDAGRRSAAPGRSSARCSRDELDIREIVVPPYAGNFSAWGLLGADLTQTAARTRIMRLVGRGDRRGRTTCWRSCSRQLEPRADGRDRRTREVAPRHALRRPGAHADDRRAGRRRHLGGRRGDPRARSRASTTRTFGHSMDEEVEIVSLRATLRTDLPRRAAEQPRTARTRRGAGDTIEAWSFARGERLPFALVDATAAIGADGSPARRSCSRRRRRPISTPASRPCSSPAASSIHDTREAEMLGEPVVYRAGLGGDGVLRTPIRSRPRSIRHGLNSAAEQMKRALIRTAFSPDHLRGARLRGRALRPRMRLLAQAPSLPIFMGTMSFCVEAAVEEVGGEDGARARATSSSTTYPYGTGSHPQDAAVVMPVFLPDGRAGRLHGDQGALARHRRQGAVLAPTRSTSSRRGRSSPASSCTAAASSSRTSTGWRSPTRACRRWSPATSTPRSSACAPAAASSSRLVERYGLEAFRRLRRADVRPRRGRRAQLLRAAARTAATSAAA